MKCYFPTTEPAKVILIAGKNPPAREGFEIREASAEELAEVKAGRGYYSPGVNGGGTFSAPPAKVPAEIQAWRGRAIARLTVNGGGTLYDAATALFDTLPEPQQSIAKEVFHGTTWARKSSMLASLTAALGLTEEAVDQLFVNAANLPS